MILRNAFYRDLPDEQKKFDYGVRTDGQAVYRGYAKLGTADTESKWILVFTKFNDDGTVAEEYSLVGAWSDRVNLFLEFA